MSNVDDQQVVARLRAALDEVTAERAIMLTSMPVTRRTASATRWMMIAATFVLALAATIAVAINRRGTVEPAAPAPPGATSTTSTSFSAEIDYRLISPDLVLEGTEETASAADPSTMTVVWARTAGPAHGLLIAESVPAGTIPANGETVRDGVAFRSYGLTTVERDALADQVVPGSGLPYVLPVDGWTFLALGNGSGVRRASTFRHLNGGGSVVISVGDYIDEFQRLIALGGSIDDVSVAGNAGWKAQNADGATVVWPAGESGQWARMEIPGPLVDRVDGLIAAIVSNSGEGTGATSTSSLTRTTG